jgi:hypothetical protein
MLKIAITTLGVIFAMLVISTGAPQAQNGKGEPIFSADDLLNRCRGTETDRQLCYAYLRGFSDGNRWLVHDQPGGALAGDGSVCIPNREPIGLAADLLVARFRGRPAEVGRLSPFRAISIALGSRYSCDRLFDAMPSG